MNAKKKLIPMKVNAQPMVENIAQQVPSSNTAEHAALRKDAHLLAAAYEADRVLLTADRKLYDLCEKHAVLQTLIEWLKLLPQNTASENDAPIHRLQDLSTSRPNPPLPSKHKL